MAVKLLSRDLRSSKSPLVLRTSSLFLSLSPIAQGDPTQGLCAEHLSPLLLTYYPPFKGVILSYSNVRLSDHPTDEWVQETSASSQAAVAAPLLSEPVYAVSIAEYAVSYVWLTADFLVFRPKRGVWIDGFINLQNESHIGLVVWNFFSASIDRRRLPKEWRWVEDSSGNENEFGKGTGCFVDTNGDAVDGVLRFRIRDFDVQARNEYNRGFFSIKGTLLGDEEDSRVDEERRKEQ